MCDLNRMIAGILGDHIEINVGTVDTMTPMVVAVIGVLVIGNPIADSIGLCLFEKMSITEQIRTDGHIKIPSQKTGDFLRFRY